MGIQVTGSRMHILMLEHMAEQADFGDVDGYVQNFILNAMYEHPAWRDCMNPECGVFFYPRLECVPVEDGSWKEYRVRVHPVDTCPGCGQPTKKNDWTSQPREVSDIARAFADGKSKPRPNGATRRSRPFDGHVPHYMISLDE